MTNYLQVNYDGTIFQYSKEPKEGFVEFKNSKDKISYRKYFNKGVDGQLTDIFKKNNEHINNREEVSLVLENGDVKNILTFTVLGQQGDSLDEYTEALALLLPKLTRGNTYNVNNYFMKKGDVIGEQEVKYNKKGVTIKSEGTKIKTSLTFEHVKNRGTKEETHVKGDVPMLIWSNVAGKNRPTAASKENKLIFLYNLLDSQINRLAKPSEETTTAPTQTAPPPTDLQPDDLPF